MSQNHAIRFPRAVALDVARQLTRLLRPLCEPDRIVFAGSLRRGRPSVGDLEIVYIPRQQKGPKRDLFKAPAIEDRVTPYLLKLIDEDILEHRSTATGGRVFGFKNKLLRHCDTGLPLDFFATTEGSWYSYLVCRTGGKENNIAIANAAKAKGWRWNPYQGFIKEPSGETFRPRSEVAVYDFVGLPYLPPSCRP